MCACVTSKCVCMCAPCARWGWGRFIYNSFSERKSCQKTKSLKKKTRLGGGRGWARKDREWQRKVGVRGRERAAGDGGCLEVREREYEKMKFMFDLERNSNGLKLKLYIICLIIIFSIMMEIPVIPVIPVCVCAFFLLIVVSLSLSYFIILSTFF